ncbi:MAG: hypothetical protein AB7R69_03785 [Candidatus Babeliales bacterium]
MKIILSLMLCTFFVSSAASNNLLILDTGNQNPSVYHTLMTFARQAGLRPTYHHFYHLESPDIEQYQTIIIALDNSMFHALARELSNKHSIKNPILQHVFTLFEKIRDQKNKTIMLLLPHGANPIGTFSLAHHLLRRLGIQEKRVMSSDFDTFLKQGLQHMVKSDASKSRLYDTSMLPASYTKQEAALTELKPLYKKNNELVATGLPLQNCMFDSALRPIYPLGFYIKNRATGNQFFITTNNAVTFADIKDPFVYNPVDLRLRTALLEGLQAFMHECAQASATGNLKPTEKKAVPVALLAQSFAKLRNTVHDQRNIMAPPYNWTKKGVACGWLGIPPYVDNDKAIEHLLKSGMNMLWLQLNPETYLSTKAVNKEKKEELFSDIKKFTSSLRTKAAELKLPVPKLFVGMELTGNLATHRPHDPATDMYGNVYNKVPNPFDVKGFWKPELFDVLKEFVTAWQSSLGSGLPLAGIFFDFEMYHAQDQTGQFTEFMDFSDTSWSRYCRVTNKPEALTLKTTKERTSFLMRHKLMDEYFGALQQQARKLGTFIKKQINTILPGGIIAAYNINLPHNWFYQGILAGLSSAHEPVIMATFNNEFYRYYTQLANNNIHLISLPVLLLSKLQQESDVHKISDLWRLHDGIWFNRISRLEEPRKEPWDGNVESSPLQTEVVVSLLKKGIEKNWAQ